MYVCVRERERERERERRERETASSTSEAYLGDENAVVLQECLVTVAAGEQLPDLCSQGLRDPGPHQRRQTFRPRRQVPMPGTHTSPVQYMKRNQRNTGWCGLIKHEQSSSFTSVLRDSPSVEDSTPGLQNLLRAILGHVTRATGDLAVAICRRYILGYTSVERHTGSEVIVDPTI